MSLPVKDEKSLGVKVNTDHDRTPSPEFGGPPTPRRGSNEASPTRSEYAFVDPLTEKAPAIKTLNVYHTGSHLNLRITTADDQPLYYVNNSYFTPKTPDVTLHAGSEEIGEVLAVSKFNNMGSRINKTGLGDPSNLIGGNQVVWEEMERNSGVWKQTEFRFTMNIGSGPEKFQRKAFVWKRTHSLGDDTESKWSFQSFKLIDEQTGEVVTTFAENWLQSWKKKGKFRIVSGVYGDEWEKMVLITCLTLVEKARRRNRARRSGGAHGGN